MRFAPMLAALLLGILKAQFAASRAVSLDRREPFDLGWIEPYAPDEMEKRSLEARKPFDLGWIEPYAPDEMEKRSLEARKPFDLGWIQPYAPDEMERRSPMD
ncbi:hypothetical protein B0H13DRAFT_2053270 [Mycena leptocephala]|nr:hypothetical protein B0H13DRAFT_2053270 [Mycena leptocephala]